MILFSFLAFQEAQRPIGADESQTFECKLGFRPGWCLDGIVFWTWYIPTWHIDHTHVGLCEGKKSFKDKLLFLFFKLQMHVSK